MDNYNRCGAQECAHVSYSSTCSRDRHWWSSFPFYVRPVFVSSTSSSIFSPSRDLTGGIRLVFPFIALVGEWLSYRVAAQVILLTLLFALIAYLLLFYFRFASLPGSVVDISRHLGSGDKVITTTVALVFTVHLRVLYLDFSDVGTTLNNLAVHLCTIEERLVLSANVMAKAHL